MAVGSWNPVRVRRRAAEAQRPSGEAAELGAGDVECTTAVARQKTTHEDYVREDGEWKVASIKTKWEYIPPYDQGSAKNRGALLEDVPKG